MIDKSSDNYWQLSCAFYFTVERSDAVILQQTINQSINQSIE